MVGKVLIETFQETLGSEWTPAYQEAWVQAYEMIAQTMAASADVSASRDVVYAIERRQR
jgi:hemoglobin-like flavoprotein